MAIIGLLMLALVVMAFVMRGAPKPDLEKTPPKSPPKSSPKSSAKSSAAEIPHPWASGVKGDIDDFASPAAPYGPGTTDEPEKD